MTRVRVALVTNIPAPYRLPVYELLAREHGLDPNVVFCSGREPDRAWDLTEFRFGHVFLEERFATLGGRYVHANPDVWGVLSRLRPEVVVTTGFNPTHLLAFAWARRHGAAHVAMTDGTQRSESALTPLHRAVRRHVYARSAAFVGASEGSFNLYRSYGVHPASMFKSHLCADNTAFSAEPARERDVDLLFCGRFAAGKRPLFALQVARAVAERLGRRVRLLFVGSGELDAAVRAAAARCIDRVDTEFAGFARQAELPRHYARAKLLLFPTVGDTWGVVANEACAAGVPVLTCGEAGVAGELVRDGENGHVQPLDLARWVDTAARLLADDNLRDAMAQRGRELVQPYHFANAAAGLAAALRHALQARHGGWQGAEPQANIVSRRRRRRVVIVQRRLTRYRVPLFERLRVLLAEQAIDLDLVVGDATPDEQLKLDGGKLDWSLHVPCTYLWRGRLCWQWAWPHLRGADLVVVTQENKLLLNLVLMLRRRRLPMALWGHGRNFQATQGHRVSEVIKRWLLRRADWWFAYTELTRDLVLAAGFPAERVTVLNNAIDTHRLAADLQKLDARSSHALRARFGLGAGPVVLVLSSLQADKRIGFLIDVARLAQACRPDLQLLVVGDGAERAVVRRAAQEHSWIHWLGTRNGIDKAACLKVASAMLQPHGIGLVALDSLLAGVPLVTLPEAGHGPEIAYLRADINCVMAPRHDAAACAQALVDLLADEPRRSRLATQCRADAVGFGIEPMAQRFCEGILLALRGTGQPAAAEATA